ncbi:MAG: hypothetical protein ACE5FZ_06375 [Nitrospiria bacterium]
MKRVLYILKERNDAYPLDLIQEQAASCYVTVILIRGAIGLEIPDSKVSVCALSEDGKDQGLSDKVYRQIDYKEMLETIFACDTVLTW